MNKRSLQAAFCSHRIIAATNQGRDMNRRKKINQTLKNKAKKANAKLHSNGKPAYVSKAERARLEALEADQVESTIASK